MIYLMGKEIFFWYFSGLCSYLNWVFSRLLSSFSSPPLYASLIRREIWKMSFARLFVARFLPVSICSHRASRWFIQTKEACDAFSLLLNQSRSRQQRTISVLDEYVIELCLWHKANTLHSNSFARSTFFIRLSLKLTRLCYSVLHIISLFITSRIFRFAWKVKKRRLFVVCSERCHV